MNASITTLQATLIDDDAELTWVQIRRACHVDDTELQRWVREGVLQPLGGSEAAPRFAGSALRRARVAARLRRDFELDTPALALALDLLDEIGALRARLARAGV